MHYSIFQLAIFDAVVESNEPENLIINAVAGSGKTSTIVEACNRLPSGVSVLFLAFNVKIVEELKSRLPRWVNCATFNSVGWRAWLRFTGKKFLKVNADKNYQIAREMLDSKDFTIYGPFISKMVALAKSSGIGGKLMPNVKESWLALLEQHDVFIDHEEADYNYGITLAMRALEESIRIAEWSCDFDDQLYMPYLNNAPFQKYDYVFGDEMQDTNPVQKELLARMLNNKTGRLIAVGDPDQAIYGFRGADSTSMEQVKTRFSAREMPLSICWRCSKAVVREAQKYVSRIQFAESSPEGAVHHLDRYAATDFRSSDAIVCRNNAPLVKMAYQLITRGIAVNFLGRDLGSGLCTLIKNMKAKSIDDLEAKLDAWIKRESDKFMKKDQEAKVAALNDRLECINIFISNLSAENYTIEGLIEEITNLFKDVKTRAVTLCSVHKSKGLEYDRVFILDFAKLMPSPYAKKMWQLQQENNLIYVAITRAKNTLCYITSDGMTDSAGKKVADVVNDQPFVSPKVTDTRTDTHAHTSESKSLKAKKVNPFDFTKK